MSGIDVVGDVAEAAAKKLLYDVVLKAVIKKIVTAIPFLGLSWINPIVVFIVTKIADKIFKEAKDLGVFFKIEFETQEQKDEYDRATNELKEVLKKPNTNGENNAEIERKKEEFKKRLSNLIRFPDS